jgi:tetratricopeptide (TPR) repeat protein
LEGAQESLFVAIHDFIATVTGERPLILLLEDMHWSDPASLDLLHYLGRQIDALRLLLVVTYRSDELVRRHPLSHLLPRLVRDAGALRIDLRPLADDAQRALVAARYRLPPADHERLVRYVRSHAEGNPLYIRELFGTFEEQGILQTNDAGWVLGDLRHMRVPALVRQLIDERLARLDAETRDLLAVAAIIGQEVPLDLWQRVSDATVDRFDAAIAQALEARLIEESIAGNGGRFSHALIREALYEGIILTRRRVWHRRVAEAMECLSRPDPDALAYHYQHAGDMRAADWLVRAGARAQRAYALVIAADRFEAAAALTQGDAARDRERGWLLYRAGRAVIGADGARALACLEEAEQIGIAAGDAALVAYALSDRGLARCFLGEPRRGIAEMEAGIRALTALPADQTPTGSEVASWIVGTAAGTESVRPQPGPPGESPNGVALRRGQLVLWYGVSGRYREAEEQALELLAQDPEMHDDAWAGLGYVYVAAGKPAAARQAWHRARDAYRTRGRHWTIGSIVLEELDSICLAYEAHDRDARERVATEAEQAYRRAQGDPLQRVSRVRRVCRC